MNLLFMKMTINQKKVIDFTNTKYTINYAAHYADLEHELLEVKSGYRLVLTYSICWTREKDALKFKNHELEVNKLSEVLSHIKDPESQIGLLLDHRYTVSSFRSRGINALKGVDSDRYQILKQANELLPEDKQLKFFIVHANYAIYAYDISNWNYGAGFIEHTYNAASDSDESEYDRSFDENDCDWEIDVKTKYINECYDLDGKVMFGKIKKHYGLHRDEVIVSSLDFDSFSFIINPSMEDTHVDFDKLENWGNMKDEHYEGYLGNENVNATTVYNKYLIAFMTKTQAENLSLVTNPIVAIKSFLEKPQDVNVDKMKALLALIKRKQLKKELWIHLFKILVKFNDLEITKRFLSAVKKLEIDFVDAFVALIDHFGYDLLLDELAKIINVNLENFVFNCKLTEKLYVKNAEKSTDFFKKTVMPIITENGANFNTEKNLQLIQLINLFVKNDSSLTSVLESLKDKIRQRVNELRQKIDSLSEFTWCMPNAKIPQNQRLEQFFHSNQQKLEYTGFKSIQDARKFASSYTPNSYTTKDGYSCRMCANGSGKNSYVEIVKTKDIFASKEKQIQTYRQELQKLNSYL